MQYWYASWLQIKTLLETNIQNNMTFEDAMADIRANNADLFAAFATNVNRQPERFIQFMLYNTNW